MICPAFKVSLFGHSLLRVCALMVAMHAVAVRADILVTGFFDGVVYRYDEATKARTTFATIPANPGLSGIAYNPHNHQVYVSALNHGGVYIFDAQSGGMLNFVMLGFGPGGLAAAPTGEVYVTDFTSNLVRVFNTSLASPPLATIAVPVAGVTSGVGLLANGHVIIATPGTGVHRYNGTTVTPFTADPAAQLSSTQVAEVAGGDIFIGHGLGYSDSALKFNSTGNLIGAITVTDQMVQSTGSGSSFGNSPAGIAVDSAGDVLVAALGKSNPGDPGGERGGLFKFDTSGNLIDTFDSATSAYSSIAIVPSTVPAMYAGNAVVHVGWSGSGTAVDSGKTMHFRTPGSATLSANNLIRAKNGITGIRIHFTGLGNPGLINAADFDFRMSPQGPYTEVDHPPAAWAAAPAPASVSVVTTGLPYVEIQWAVNSIENRWLRVTAKPTANTNLAAPVTLYLGHLRGEVDGPVANVYTVSFADISVIRDNVSAIVNSSSDQDIDKNGIISFADITAMRDNVSQQLRNITVH
ncbi:MAG: hypothetical protein KF752_01800 [Pirellulaceae bacterium]|nr:hypothetical protein [Pirellulaceae bacterium]